MPFTQRAVRKLFLRKPLLNPTEIGFAVAEKTGFDKFHLLTPVHRTPVYVKENGLWTDCYDQFVYKAPLFGRSRECYLVYTGRNDKVFWYEDRVRILKPGDTLTVHVPNGKVLSVS